MGRHLILLLCLWATTCFALDSVDPDFAPVLRGPGGVQAMAWHPSGWLYTSVNADKLNGQELSSTFVRFDEDGVRDSDYQPTIDGEVYTVDLLDSGQLIVSGTFSEVAGHATYHVARLNADGSVDTEFTMAEADLPMSRITTNNYLNAVEEGPDGVLFLGFTGGVDVSLNYEGGLPERVYKWPQIVIKLDSSGTRDADFSPDFQIDLTHGGIVLTSERLSAHTLLLSDDNTLIIGGDFELVNGQFQAALAKLDLDGNLVDEFRPVFVEQDDGPRYPHSISASIRCLAYSEDGRFYVGGRFNQINGTAQYGLARLHADGTLDTEFLVDFDTAGSWPTLNKVIALSSGELLLIGDFILDADDYASKDFVRVDSTGQWDDVFTPDFFAANGVVLGPEAFFFVNRQGAGLSMGVFQPPLAKLTSEGLREPDFEMPDLRDLRYPDSVLSLPEGRLLLQSMWIIEASDSEVPGIVVLDSSGALDATFHENFSIDGPVSSSGVLPGGRMLVGGYFTSISGVERECVAMLEADGTLVESFDLGLGSYSSLDDFYVLPSGRIFLVGRFYDAANTFLGESGIIDFNASASSSDVSFEVLWDDDFITGLDDLISVDDVAEQPDGKLVLAGWFLVNETSVDAVRLMPDGSYDLSFDPESQFSSFSPSVVEAGPDGSLYFAGSSFSINDESSSRYIVKFLPDGAVDTAFSGPTGYVYDLKLDADGTLWCAGSFTSSIKRIAHLDSGGNVIDIFDPGDSANSTVRSLALEAPDCLYIAGGFTEVQGVERTGLARINLKTPVKPQVRIAPIDATVGEGTAMTLALSGVGQDETYAWYHNGVALSGESGNTLSLPGLSLADAGSYTVEATNIAGTTESDASLTVIEYDLPGWLARYGLSDGGVDSDKDGRSNADEYLARTNPREANSFLDTRMARTVEGLRLGWATSPARTYQVEVCNDLVSWEPYGEPTIGHGVETGLDLTPEQMEAWRFWRVSVSKP